MCPSEVELRSFDQRRSTMMLLLLRELFIFGPIAGGLLFYLRGIRDRGLLVGLPVSVAAAVRILLASLSGVTWTFLVVFSVIFCLKGKKRSLPPGPNSLPVIGYLPWIKDAFPVATWKLTNAYGKICSFMMGQATVVVLSDYKLIKKAFSKGQFTARPRLEIFQLLGGYGTAIYEMCKKCLNKYATKILGIINTEGDLWRSQRNFLLKNHIGLRPGNSHKALTSKVDARIRWEIAQMFNVILRDYSSVAFNPSDLIDTSVANVICSMLMSTRFHHNDADFKQFMLRFDEGFKIFSNTGLATFVPAFKHLPGVQSTVQQLVEHHSKMRDFAKKIVDEHKATLDPDRPRDLVDAYLISSIDQEGFDSDRQLEQVILDLFSAGVETIRAALLWSIFFMLHYPEVKAKVQRELDSVIGDNNLPEFSDRTRLPYTWATMCEVLRKASVVPIGTTHSNYSECSFEDYTIPRNSHVIPHIQSVHMDPKVFPNPEEFLPERFLSADSSKVVRPEEFMPFGVGMRRCLGDKLAEKELFLFFSSLMHTFDLVAQDDLPSLSDEGTYEITHTPSPFKVMYVPRKSVDLRTFNNVVRNYG